MRQAEWIEANLRIRRLCPEAYATYTREHAYSQRWRAFEKMTVPLTLNEDLLHEPGMTKETECCICAASTSTELLHKFTLLKTAQRSGRFDATLVFRDRVLRGEESQPLPDLPEWAEYKAKMSATVREAGERTGEQIRSTVRNFLSLQGMHSRDMPSSVRKALGIGRLGDDWKGR